MNKCPPDKEITITVNDNPKILIVDDSERVLRTLRRILAKEDYSVEMAQDGEEALDKVCKWLPDLVLLDVRMPKIDGMEVCRRIKNNHKYSFMYVIMLTIKSGTEDEVAGFDTGADDYVPKPFNPHTLLARVRRGLRMVKEKQDASFDPLTKLYNRRVFELFMDQETAKFRRYQHPLSLVMADLDDFKKINDTFGHKTGDLILQEFANILRRGIREADLPARWGGEEFAVLLPETDIKGAEKLAECLCQTIGMHDFPNVGHLTASFGVAGMTDADHDLVQVADKALYQAKQTGRNKVVTECAER